MTAVLVRVSYAGPLQEFPGGKTRFEAENLLAWEVNSVPTICVVQGSGVGLGGGVPPFAHVVNVLAQPKRYLPFTPLPASQCPDLFVSLIDASTGRIIFYAYSNKPTVGP